MQILCFIEFTQGRGRREEKVKTALQCPVFQHDIVTSSTAIHFPNLSIGIIIVIILVNIHIFNSLLHVVVHIMTLRALL